MTTNPSRTLVFAARNAKEILRDAAILVFGLCLPAVLILFIYFLNRGVPAAVFEMESFAPGMAVFSYSFITMFTSSLMSRDMATSFLTRLRVSPMKSREFIAGYALPMIPMSIAQTLVCFGVAALCGLKLGINTLIGTVCLIPVSFLFIALGLLLGCLLNEKQAPPISSAVTQATALLSGMWFDLSLIGGGFAKVMYLLPFAHAYDTARFSYAGEYGAMLPHLLWTLGYTAVIFAAAVAVFKKKTSR